MKLSSAQKRALLGIPVHRAFIPEHTGFQWPTLAVLKQHRLINGLADGFAGKGKWARHTITPKGLRLRFELEACLTASVDGRRMAETNEDLAQSEGGRHD